MKRQSGVTLVEVLLVLVVLGVIALIMAPRYMDYSEDSRASSVRTLESSLLAFADMTYARAAYDGVERREHDVVELSGGQLPVRYGYPNFLAAESAEGIEQLVYQELNIATNLWDYSYNESSRAVRVSPSGVNGDVNTTTLDSVSACYVEYLPPENPGDRPQINVSNDSC